MADLLVCPASTRDLQAAAGAVGGMDELVVGQIQCSALMADTEGAGMVQSGHLWGMEHGD